MRLRDTQQLLWRLITASEGVVQGLAELPDRECVLRGGLEALIRGDERAPALERLDIYANMYFFRLFDCLKEDFPALLGIIGEERFHDLVTGYLVEHPPSHPSVRFLGRHLAEHLGGHELAGRWPFLPDLAKLEWSILEAFDAADADPLPPERLQALPSEDWAGARLVLTPSLQILETRFGVDALWEAAVKGEAPAPPAAKATTIRVWRQDLRVFHRAIEPIETAAIRAAAGDFGKVCEIIAGLCGENDAPAAALGILSGWFADGLIVGLEPSPRSCRR